jgi:hypothetical protein
MPMPPPHHCHATALGTTTATKVKGDVCVTGQRLTVAGEDDWWRRILIFIRMLIILTADLFLGRGCVQVRGWLYGMGMDLYKSQFLDGCPDGSGTKTTSYKPASQIIYY